jgi:hypothetical protein
MRDRPAVYCALESRSDQTQAGADKISVQMSLPYRSFVKFAKCS